MMYSVNMKKLWKPSGKRSGVLTVTTPEDIKFTILAPVVQVLCVTLRQWHLASTENMKQTLKDIANAALRKQESLWKPGVSIEAAKIAKNRDFPVSLSEMGYDDRKKLGECGFDVSNLHYEHATPVTDMWTDLRAIPLENVVPDVVFNVLKRSAIVWITVEENSRLPQHHRDTFEIAYAKANILLCK